MASLPDASARRIEQRSLRLSWRQCCDEHGRVFGKVLSGSNALLLDGLYLAALVVSSLIASHTVTQSQGRQASRLGMALWI